MAELLIQNLDDIDRVATEFLQLVGNRRHFAFVAPMGSGKTTFISALCRALGMEEEASSPTFAIVNEYASRSVAADVAGAADVCDVKPVRVFHFDFYRLDTLEEVADLGLDEYFDTDAYCFMEWPEIAAPLLPDDTLPVRLTPRPDGTRLLSF